MTNYTGTRGYTTGATPSTAAYLALPTLTLSTDATAILAFWGAGAQAAETTVEGVLPKMFFTVGPLTYGPFAMTGQGNGAATNEAPFASPVQVWPLSVPKNAPAGGIGGLQVIPNGIVDQRGTPTNGNSFVGGCLTWEGPLSAMPPGLLDEIREALRSGAQMSFVNGAVSAGTAATSATAVTANATALANITVLPDANAITGLDLAYASDAALTAGNECVGWMDFTSSISGFGTQSYPFAATGAALGTAVGNLIQYPVTSLPAYIPTSSGARANWTITPTVRLNATVDATNFLAGAYWR